MSLGRLTRRSSAAWSATPHPWAISYKCVVNYLPRGRDTTTLLFHTGISPSPNDLHYHRPPPPPPPPPPPSPFRSTDPSPLPRPAFRLLFCSPPSLFPPSTRPSRFLALFPAPLHLFRQRSSPPFSTDLTVFLSSFRHRLAFSTSAASHPRPRSRSRPCPHPPPRYGTAC